MAGKKEPPFWELLGYKKVMTPSGKNIKGFETPEGDYISYRQYKKLKGTPGKGSQGYKERMKAKEKGIDLRPKPTGLTFKMKEFAEKPGATLQWFKTGKPPMAREPKTRQEHNAYVDKQRRASIKFKAQSGIFDEETEKKARELYNEQKKLRNDLGNLHDKITDRDYWRKKGAGQHLKERKKLNEKYQKKAARYHELQEEIDLYGIIPNEGDLREGWYH